MKLLLIITGIIIYQFRTKTPPAPITEPPVDWDNWEPVYKNYDKPTV